MGVKVEAMAGLPDSLKWALIAVIVIATLTVFYVFADQSLLLRVIGLLLALGGACAIAMQTETGRQGWGFVKDSRTEVRKVVWPTRQETLQTNWHCDRNGHRRRYHPLDS